MPLVALMLTAPVLWAADGTESDPDETAGVEMSFLNTTYTGLDSGLVPIRQGSLTIYLSSPEHRLTVYSNRLALGPITGTEGATGRFAAELAFELDGEGRLLAEVSGVGPNQRFTDDVAVSRQTVVATGEVTVERRDDGFLFTLDEPGPAVEVEIQSALAGEILEVCRVLAVLPLFDMGCDQLERGLSVARIPMPEPGTQVMLLDAYLTSEEREALAALIR